MSIVYPPGSVQDIAGRRLLGALESRPAWTAGDRESPDAPLAAQHYTEPLAFGHIPTCLWASAFWVRGSTTTDPGGWQWVIWDERRGSAGASRNHPAASSESPCPTPSEAIDSADAVLDALVAGEVPAGA